MGEVLRTRMMARGTPIAGSGKLFNSQGETICGVEFVLSGFVEECPAMNRKEVVAGIDYK